MKNIFNFKSRKGKVIFGITFLISLGIIFLPSITWAQENLLTNIFNILSLPVKLAILIPGATILLVLGIAQFITAILPFIAGSFLTWILNAPINLTSGGVVDVGVEFTRDFANLFFILILVAIAIATILRLETYGMKKALPMLILVALLINFSSVICGVILDAVQVVMDFFKTSATSAVTIFLDQNTLVNVFKITGEENEAWKLLKGLVGDSIPSYLNSMAGIVLQGLVGVLYNLLAFIILGVYVLIFLLRIIIIWILVILAPLAWLGLAFPAIRSFWSTWWKQFLQWAIIGIPLLFFLWLSGHVLSAEILSSSCIETIGEETQWGWEAFTGGALCALLAPLTAIALLVIGVFAGIAAGDIGAKMAMRGAVAGGMALAAGVWMGGKKLPETKAGKAVGAWAEKHPRLTAAAKYTYMPWRGAEKIPKVGPGIRKGREWVERRVGKAAGEKIEKYLGLAPPKELGKQIEEAIKNLEHRSSSDLKKDFDLFGAAEKTASLQVLSSRGERGLLSSKQQENALKTALRAGKENRIFYRDPRIARDFADTITSITKKPAPTITEVLSEMPAEQAHEIHEEALTDREVAVNLSTSQLKNIGEKGSPKKMQQLRNIIEVHGSPEQKRYFSSSPGWNVETKAPKTVKGTEEEFREAREKHGPRAFG